MKRVGIVLSGYGVYGGSETHETVSTLSAVSRSGAQAVYFVPGEQQVDIISHLTGEAATETRDVLIGATRITRDEIRPLTQADAVELDALIAPGGFGTARNLSDFASLSSERTVGRELKVLIQTMYQAGEPLGFMCIAPVTLPKIFDSPLRSIIGIDIGTAEVLEEMGTEHIPCPTGDIVVDEDSGTVTTPTYVLAQSIAETASGIDKLVPRVLALAE